VTPYPWPLRSHLELGALPTAVPRARRHARHLLWEWGLNGLTADIELLVSELVTNAVKATAGQQQAAIRLRLSSDSARVLVEIWDANPQPPAPKDLGEGGTPDPEEEGGRGRQSERISVERLRRGEVGDEQDQALQLIDSHALNLASRVDRPGWCSCRR
jgi:anti-sigma regulatory factor (Ser/Thr protein kinase)